MLLEVFFAATLLIGLKKKTKYPHLHLHSDPDPDPDPDYSLQEARSLQLSALKKGITFLEVAYKIRENPLLLASLFKS